MTQQHGKKLLPFLLALAGSTLACRSDAPAYDKTRDPVDVGNEGSSDNDSDDDEQNADDHEDRDADQDEDQGSDEQSSDDDGNDQDTGDGDTNSDHQNFGDGDDDSGDGDDDSGDGDDDEPVKPPAFDELAAKAVLLRSCGACHKPGHPKFSIIAGSSLDMDAVRARADAMARSLYDQDEPMPPYRAQGQLALSNSERSNLKAYLLWLADAS
jgi:hypothetical protein